MDIYIAIVTSSILDENGWEYSKERMGQPYANTNLDEMTEDIKKLEANYLTIKGWQKVLELKNLNHPTTGRIYKSILEDENRHHVVEITLEKIFLKVI